MSGRHREQVADGLRFAAEEIAEQRVDAGEEALAGGLVHAEQAAGIGVIQTLLATPPEHHDPDLAEAMYDAVLAQILTDTPDLPEGGPMATAVTFRAIAPELTILSTAERKLLDDWLDRIVTGL